MFKRKQFKLWVVGGLPTAIVSTIVLLLYCLIMDIGVLVVGSALLCSTKLCKILATAHVLLAIMVYIVCNPDKTCE